MDSNANPKLDAYTVRLIKNKAWQLVGRAGFTKDDREDIEQDLTVSLLQRLPKFNPARGSLHTFMDRVVEHEAARLIENRQAPMRDYRRAVCSLNETVKDDNGEEAERGDLIDQDGYRAQIGEPALPMADFIALNVDLERMAKARPDLRDLWRRLAAGQTLTHISQETGIPRGTLYERMKELRKLAERMGLKGYL